MSKCNCSICGRVVTKLDANGFCTSCQRSFLIGEYDSNRMEHIPNGLEEYYRDLRKEEGKDKISKPEPKVLTPIDIHNKLNEHIVGQEEAKKVLSVAAYNHYKKINYGVECIKSNILLVGPTGCGKTLFAKSLAEVLDVPLTIADATSLTSAGYVGEDVGDILAGLIKVAGNDLRLAEKGIVFLDEIDKIKKSSNPGRSKDIGGESVQQALLRLLEGAKVSVNLGSRQREETVLFDTSNVLFICAGSFAGIEPILQKRIVSSNSIGFGAKVVKEDIDNNIVSKVTNEDLEKFGMIPELLGRLPILAKLNQLTEEDLCRIITEPKDSILKQFNNLFAIDKTELKFTSTAIKAIVQKAIKNKTGARGLRTIIEQALLNTMYKLPSIEGQKTLTLTGSHINKGTDPEIKIKDTKEKA